MFVVPRVGGRIARAGLAALLLCLSAAPRTARGQDAPELPETAQEAVVRLAALDASLRDAEIGNLVRAGKPDPWHVVDEALETEHRDLAVAIATAVAAPSGDGLPLRAYVGGWTRTPADVAARKVYRHAADLAKSGLPEAAAQLLEVAEPRQGTVLAVDVSWSLAGLQAAVPETAARAAQEYARCGDAAAEIGWYARTFAAYTLAWKRAWVAGDLPLARRRLEKLRRVQLERGREVEATRSLVNLAILCGEMRDYATASAQFAQALRAMGSPSDEAGRRFVATTRGNMGLLHQRMGNYAQALAEVHDALSYFQGQGSAGEADNRIHYGRLRLEVGQAEDALKEFVAAEAIYAKLPRPDLEGQGIAVGNQGLAKVALGFPDAAKLLFSRALVHLESGARKPSLIPLALSFYARALVDEGDVEGGVTFQRAAVKRAQALGDKTILAQMKAALGGIHLGAGRVEEARREFEEALDVVDSLPPDEVQVQALSGLAACDAESGRDREAVREARRGLGILLAIASGLNEDAGATLRSNFRPLYQGGVKAAARLSNAEAALEFFEAGRAGALLESLGGLDALKAATIPASLVDEALQARTNEIVASAKVGKEAAAGPQPLRSAPLLAWRESERALQDSMQRLELRKLDAAKASRWAPEPLSTCVGRLQPGEVLLHYGLFEKDPVALILASGSDPRFVALPSIQGLEDLVLSLSADADAPTFDKSLAALRKMVVEPLRLGGGVKRVLVSPDGPLCYAPMNLLFPEHEVCLVPSATTYGLLAESRGRRGEKILAVGGCDYKSTQDESQRAVYRAGIRLSDLPDSGPEVDLIGGLVLKGKDATRERLQEVLSSTSRTWRAIHFACHGLANPRRPLLSSLALTATATDHGFLTTLDVVSMPMHADLAVLSACQSGKGKIVEGEGMLGFPRAFMLAGSPRVIVSVWDADDAAALELWKYFYEIWAPKDPAVKPMGTAAALKAAQEHVRTFRNAKGVQVWEHPKYWAAWVLWGLPD